MGDTSLFIVRSPLQLFNCVEASKRYDDCGDKILLILFRKDVDRELMGKVVSGSDVVWEKIEWGDIRSNLQQLKLVFSLLRRNMRIKYCFCGDSTRIFNILINSLTPEQVILIDDGASTYRRAMVVTTREYEVLDRFQKKIPKIVRWTEKLLRLGPDYLGKSSFFTMYQRIQAYSEDLRLVHNDYRFFRRQVANLPVRKEIFFVGSDIRRYILTEQDKFEFYLAKVAEYYAGRKWTYILHRKENESPGQRAFMDGMAEKYGFEIDIFDRILEQQILHQGWIPEEISTFYSSALDTLSVIYQPNSTVFKLRSEDVVATSQFALSEMHRHYREMGVKVIDI